MSVSELLLLKRSFERLDKQYRSAEDKIGDFRDKLREARLELASKDRQLDAAKKLLAKMGQERSELVMVAEQNRELTRSLGAKLSLSPEVPELQAKLQRSKRKVSELAAQLHEAQTRLLMLEEVGRQQATEVAVLKKALGLRSELPELGGGYDGQAQLLQALAKSQEESASLAAQLAESSRRVATVEQQVVQMRGEMERAAAGRVAAEEALAAARRETGEAHGRASSLQIDLEEVQSQLRRTNTHLKEVQTARKAGEEAVDSLTAKNRHLKDKLAAAERAGKAQAESLRAELRSLAEATEAEVQQLHALHAAREGGWEAQLAALQKQLQDMETRLSQSDRDHEVEVLRLQSRAGALEASLEGSRLREGSLERDAEALREEVARLTKANNELAANLAAARNEAEAHAERAEEAANSIDSERRLRMQVQIQLEASSTRAAVREEQLAAETQRLRGEAAALAIANDRLQADLKLCQEKLSDASARHATNERHFEELHGTIQSLTKSKTKLQNTMLEQLSLFKSKLHQVEQENLTLRTALASSAAAARDQRPTRGSPGALADAYPPGGGGGGRAGGGGGGGSSGASGGAVSLTLRDLGAAGGGGGGGGRSGGGEGSGADGSSTTTVPTAHTLGLRETRTGGGGGGITAVAAAAAPTAGGGGGTSALLRSLRAVTGVTGIGGGGGSTGLYGVGGSSGCYRSDSSSLLYENSLSEDGRGLGGAAGVYDVE